LFFNRLMMTKFRLGFFVGTRQPVKYLPLAESNKIPLIGLFTGSQTLYTPLRHSLPYASWLRVHLGQTQKHTASLFPLCYRISSRQLPYP